MLKAWFGKAIRFLDQQIEITLQQKQPRRVGRNASAIGVLQIGDAAGECRAGQAHACKLPVVWSADVGTVTARQKESIARLDHRFPPIESSGDVPLIAECQDHVVANDAPGVSLITRRRASAGQYPQAG